MTSNYRILRFRDEHGAARAGVLQGARVLALRDLAGFEDADAADPLADWPAFDRRLRAALAASDSAKLPSQPLAGTTLLAPLARFGALYCAGVNYRDHVQEMARIQNRTPEPDPKVSGFAPWHFIKPARSCVADPGASVERPAGCERLDWEAELAVLIGTEARRVAPEDALAHVAGYMVANDLSARDLSRRPQVGAESAFRFDWLAHKGFEGSCPLGPWLTPAHAVADPQRLAIRLWVNDALKQDSSTAEMIYSAAEQIAHLSQLRTLYPGDVVLTGTPSGVGSAHQQFLQPGDEVIVEIESLGRLRTLIS
ncbi:fumarylacetoacetate hydrolase family protein [Ramlibacter sp.]|uniref:fumarylacetoacetate hydrolase family protein n=1 Tax=Ramlibacter sp. TaxID=1917967 RepID=UPI00261E6736|nr:fumarylacetoacetate hydrolase family protein [Ramlibacter sp.]MDB5955234.1 hydrolase family protein [Ramlibacter sp.]